MGRLSGRFAGCINKYAFVNDENFDPEEALEAAIDNIIFLIKRFFSDTRPTNTV